jgi:hypothetical protein
MATASAVVPSALADGKDAAPPAAGAGKLAPVATDAEATAALERFDREFKTEDIDRRLDALTALRKVVHAKVADRLVNMALKHPDDTVRKDAFKGLGAQHNSFKTIGPRVAKFLAEEAEVNRKAKARGDYGVLIDIKTGEVDIVSEEGRKALAAKRQRGAMLAGAVSCLDRVEYRDRNGVETLQEFLQDGNDELVALVLATFGKWKEWSMLPDMLDLYEMYPTEDHVEVGSVSVDTGAAGGADAAAARRKWMAKFGDPDKRRPRPKLVRALKQALLDITGKEFKEPRELREHLKEPEVKRKVKGR